MVSLTFLLVYITALLYHVYTYPLLYYMIFFYMKLCGYFIIILSFLCIICCTSFFYNADIDNTYIWYTLKEEDALLIKRRILLRIMHNIQRNTFFIASCINFMLYLESERENQGAQTFMSKRYVFRLKGGDVVWPSPIEIVGLSRFFFKFILSMAQ